MKFFIIVISVLALLFTGCNYGKVKAHKTFTKVENATILNFDELPVYVGVIGDCNITKKNSIRVVYTNYADDLYETDKYIVVLFKHTGTAWGGSNDVGRVVIDLCKNGIPSQEDTNNKNKGIAVFPNFCPTKDDTLALLTTPKILEKQGLLDKDYKAKDDICIYPGDNIPFKTMKKEDWFKITKEEINKVLDEWEDF